MHSSERELKVAVLDRQRRRCISWDRVTLALDARENDVPIQILERGMLRSLRLLRSLLRTHMPMDVHARIFIRKLAVPVDTPTIKSDLVVNVNGPVCRRLA